MKIMNFKLISLIIVVILSVILFFFISYAEFTEGMQSLVTGAGNLPAAATKNTLTEGMMKAMESIDRIVK